ADLCGGLGQPAGDDGVVDGKSVDVADEFVDLEIRDLKTEVIRGDIFYQMGLIEDHGAVIGNDAAVLVAADAKVGEKEMVVNDDDISGVGTCPHTGDEAGLEIGTLLPDADIAAGVDAMPE